MHHLGEHFTIGAVRSRFSFGLQFAVEFKQAWIFYLFAMNGKDGMQSAEYPGFPID
jgi:hypothetical protein